MLLNAFSNFEHENGFSPVWVLSCFFNPLLFLNAFSHFDHFWKWFLSSVDTFRSNQSTFFAKGFPHLVQAYVSLQCGSNYKELLLTSLDPFMKIASLQCGYFHVSSNLHFLLKVLAHLVQKNGSSPVWILSCFFKSPLFMSNPCHIWSSQMASLQILSCLFKPTLYVNVLSH